MGIKVALWQWKNLYNTENYSVTQNEAIKQDGIQWLSRGTPLQYVIRSLNKGYFGLRILSRPDIQDIYCNILHKYIPLITDQYSMRLKCYS